MKVAMSLVLVAGLGFCMVCSASAEDVAVSEKTLVASSTGRKSGIRASSILIR